MTTSSSPAGATAPPFASPWRRVCQLIRVRLRFVAVLVAIALVVGQWEWVSTHFHRWLNRWTSASAQQAVSPDTEYFCPMCPGVLSGWPDTCPVCNMPLVRRRKGEAQLLPTGVVARMQFSTQRIQLAGLQTAAVEYRDLAYEIQAAGRLTAATRPADAPATDRSPATTSAWFVDTFVPASDVPLLARAERIDAFADGASSDAPWPARLLDWKPAGRGEGMARVRFELAIDDAHAVSGLVVRVRLTIPVARVEPFRAQPRGLPPLQPGEPRIAWICPQHEEHVEVAPRKCPHDSLPLEGLPLADHQRIRWCCPEHGGFLSDQQDAHCPQCPDQRLVARVITYAPEGQVLAVPESAVIDTGHEQLVYVESAPGMFDGVRVRLGIRAGGYYPVLDGLTSGQRVVARGAFLVDAESRLNPSVASTYFGAAGPAPGTSAPAAGNSPAPVSLQEVRRLLAKIDMSSKDRELAERQRVCPVTGMALGSMGKPPKMMVAGEPVFLCCEGCESGLAKLPVRKKTSSGAAVP